MKIITDPPQRTRALYKWEIEMQDWPGCRFLGPRQAQTLLTQVWRFEGFPAREPALEYRIKDRQQAYCDGWTRIRLTRIGHDNVTLLHEIVHAARMGTQTNPHSVGFVRLYCALLGCHMRRFTPARGRSWWARSHLVCQAEMRGLL